jgi:ribonuclease PH
MRTECFQPAIIKKDNINNVSNHEKIVNNENVVLSKGWCKTDGVIGSAYCELGGSQVACYVFAPRPSTKLITGFESGTVECDVTFAAHLLTDDEDTISNTQKRLSQKLVDAITPVVLLDQYPKSVIYISAVILQSSVYDLSNLVNASSLALCDAAVELRDILAACTLSIPSQDKSGHYLQLAYMPKAQEITGLETIGRFNVQTLQLVTSRAQTQCEKLRDIIVSKLK